MYRNVGIALPKTTDIIERLRHGMTSRLLKSCVELQAQLLWSSELLLQTRRQTKSSVPREGFFYQAGRSACIEKGRLLPWCVSVAFSCVSFGRADWPHDSHTTVPLYIKPLSFLVSVGDVLAIFSILSCSYPDIVVYLLYTTITALNCYSRGSQELQESSELQILYQWMGARGWMEEIQWRRYSSHYWQVIHMQLCC